MISITNSDTVLENFKSVIDYARTNYKDTNIHTEILESMNLDSYLMPEGFVSGEDDQINEAINVTDAKIIHDGKGTAISVKINGKEYRYVSATKSTAELYRSFMGQLKYANAGYKALNWLKKNAMEYYGSKNPSEEGKKLLGLNESIDTDLVNIADEVIKKYPSNNGGKCKEASDYVKSLYPKVKVVRCSLPGVSTNGHYVVSTGKFLHDYTGDQYNKSFNNQNNDSPYWVYQKIGNTPYYLSKHGKPAALPKEVQSLDTNSEEFLAWAFSLPDGKDGYRLISLDSKLSEATQPGDIPPSTADSVIDPDKDKKINESVSPTSEVIRTDKSGMSYYDDFLNPKDHDYKRLAKGLQGEIVYMAPMEYIKRLGTDIFHCSTDRVLRGVDQNNIDNIASKMASGTKYNIPILDLANQTQEGRHRALAAEKLGVKKIPVLVVTKWNARKELGMPKCMDLWYGHTIEWTHKDGTPGRVTVGLDLEKVRSKVQEIVKSGDYQK